jgi:hypothetical protein
LGWAKISGLVLGSQARAACPYIYYLVLVSGEEVFSSLAVAYNLTGDLFMEQNLHLEDPV